MSGKHNAGQTLRIRYWIQTDLGLEPELTKHGSSLLFLLVLKRHSHHGGPSSSWRVTATSWSSGTWLYRVPPLKFLVSINIQVTSSFRSLSTNSMSSSFKLLRSEIPNVYHFASSALHQLFWMSLYLSDFSSLQNMCKPPSKVRPCITIPTGFLCSWLNPDGFSEGELVYCLYRQHGKNISV